MRKPVLIACILAISAVTLVTYYPAAKIGFVNNDWIQLDWAARWDLPRYLYAYLVPSAEMGSYRPVYGLYFWAMYVIFGPNQSAFHLAYIILHLLNGLLVFALVKRFATNSLLAAIAALLWVGFPAYSKAVYWPSVLDTIVTFFYLGAIWFWFEFLQKGKRRHLLLAFGAFLLTLMTKEMGVTLPIALFLVDRLLVCGSMSWHALIRRYVPFLLVWIPYLIMEYAIQRSSSYVNSAGYGFGIHMFWNLLNSLAALIYPWQLDPPLSYVLVAVSVVLYLSVSYARKSKVLALLGILIVLNLLPVIGFPPQWFEMRYLYDAAIVAAIIFAIVLDGGWTKLRNQRAYMLLASVVIAIALVVNGTGVAAAATDWGEIARQRAIPFRVIERNHPAFPVPTELYFVDSPTTVYDLSVMFLLRYGTKVTVLGTDDTQSNQVAHLREVPSAYVYYFDDTGKPIEVPVARDASTHSTLALPVTFNAPIRLEGYEVTTNSLKRGESLVLFLYWRAEEKIKVDYTVFVHLVGSTGTTIAAYDGQPRQGKSPTSTWQPGQLTADVVVLPITEDVPAGEGYRLDIGLYYLPSMQRLSVVDARNMPVTDQINIEPFEVK